MVYIGTRVSEHKRYPLQCGFICFLLLLSLLVMDLLNVENIFFTD